VWPQAVLLASPGKIVDAGFFDEQWCFTTERPE